MNTVFNPWKDRIRIFSTELAIQFGCREAILLNVLCDVEDTPFFIRNLQKKLPFFTSQLIVRLMRSLKEQGAIDYTRDELSMYRVKINYEGDCEVEV